ncbi:MAG: hydrogenase maturation nickel metallochaperone HypA [Spirochaetota bacterium]
MHELSIALNILNSLQRYAVENNIKEISEISLKIGKMQAVVPDSLEFLYNMAKEEFDYAKDSKIRMNFVDIKAKCDICDEVFTMEMLNLICPNNPEHSLHIIEGNELVIESIEVEE